MTPPDEPTPTTPDGTPPADPAGLRPDEPGYPHGSQEAPAIETAEPAPAGTLKLKQRPDPRPAGDR